ncbi:AmmeMemoRadiSam system protein A [Desulfotruncus alcoholivorax]|uniref:AmmeMemoRadiSam system protein A n=1 Tax=Desulfotruncus alcoholivorax TaxID=265477 RepID=UPI000487184D|nr:AmmeMemoRadiSam system protein A [Desulfotruncus alcoholivorax]
MPVVFGGVCPHPPVMVPAVGQGRDREVAKTQKSMLELGRRIKESGAETLLMITPHGTVFSDGIGISAFKELKGDLSRFGAGEVRFVLRNDLELAREIKAAALQKGVLVVEIDRDMADLYDLTPGLDHGITAPLYFIREAGVNLPLVHVSMGMLPFSKLYSFGVAVRDAAAKLGRKVAVVASGDLSHRLTQDAPAGYDPSGKEYDRTIVKLVGDLDVEGIMDLDPDFVECAGECGLRSIIMMLGAFDGVSVKSEVLSYEGPFGVGYMVAALQPGTPDLSRNLEEKLLGRAVDKARIKRAGESYPVKIARETLEQFFIGGKKKINRENAPEEFAGRRAGVFVSLKKNGQLRGCIGTIVPTRNNIIEEIEENAISAATRDPRFYPVEPEELSELDISVDVLSDPEPVRSMDELDPRRYGVIVSSGGRRGLLLPDLEGVNTVDEQVAIAMQKAGIDPGEPVQLERFEVIRYR